MAHLKQRPEETHAVNLRVRSDIKSLIDQAARLNGQSRSDFMIESSRKAAETALLDPALVRADLETYTHFLDILDAPPDNTGFERLLRVKKPWISE